MGRVILLAALFAMDGTSGELVFADGRIVVDGLECGAETARLFRLEEGREIETREARVEYRLDDRGGALRLGPRVRLRVASGGGFEIEGGSVALDLRGPRRYSAACRGSLPQSFKKGVHLLDCGAAPSASFHEWSDQRSSLASERRRGGNGWSWFGVGGGARRSARASSARQPARQPVRRPDAGDDPPEPDEPKKLLPKGCRAVSRRALRRARRRVGEMRVVDLACRCRNGGDCSAP